MIETEHNKIKIKAYMLDGFESLKYDNKLPLLLTQESMCKNFPVLYKLTEVLRGTCEN